MLKAAIGSAVERRLSQDGVLQTQLSRKRWTNTCAQAVRDVAEDVLHPSKGVPSHDFMGIADSIDLCHRISDVNIGPSSAWMPKAVKAITDNPDDDTHLIVGLRDAIIEAAHKQARGFCGSIAPVGAVTDRDSAIEVKEDEEERLGSQWHEALLEVTATTFSKPLVMLNLAWGISDCNRFASEVVEKNGRVHVVSHPERPRYDQGGRSLADERRKVRDDL